MYLKIAGCPTHLEVLGTSAEPCSADATDCLHPPLTPHLHSFNTALSHRLLLHTSSKSSMLQRTDAVLLLTQSPAHHLDFTPLPRSAISAPPSIGQEPDSRADTGDQNPTMFPCRTFSQNMTRQKGRAKSRRRAARNDISLAGYSRILLTHSTLDLSYLH